MRDSKPPIISKQNPKSFLSTLDITTFQREGLSAIPKLQGQVIEAGNVFAKLASNLDGSSRSASFFALLVNF